MPYIDYQYYTDVFKGVSLDEDTFSLLVSRASDMIDQATNYKLSALDWDKLHELYKSRVQKAVAAQVEYLHVNGGVIAMQSTEVSQASIGSFSYTESESARNINRTISGSSTAYLRGTGLLYGGVITYG